MGVASSGGLPQTPVVQLSFEGNYLSRATNIKGINGIPFLLAFFLKDLQITHSKVFRWDREQNWKILSEIELHQEIKF